MKHKVSDLTGALLDAAVAKAEGLPWQLGARLYSQQWADGGPIIERERIDVNTDATTGGWAGTIWTDAEWPHCVIKGTGSTPLIAAMRAYCASRFGEFVELP